jgi:hypothetical protein
MFGSKSRHQVAIRGDTCSTVGDTLPAFNAKRECSVYVFAIRPEIDGLPFCGLCVLKNL